MEELQDAIEDAQYVNAIATQVQGPKPVLSWHFPEEEELASWEVAKREKGANNPGDPEIFGMDWCIQTGIGFFLFSEFVKNSFDDWVRINFIEDVIKWKKMRGDQRRERAKRIAEKYLKEVPVDDATGKRIYPLKKKIITYDIAREIPELDLSDGSLKDLLSANKIESYDSESPPTFNALGISGPVVDEIFSNLSRLEKNREMEAAVKDSQIESEELKKATEN
eukprot:jgi/Psemu1/302456/fgenesh1_kg.70_\